MILYYLSKYSIIYRFFTFHIQFLSSFYFFLLSLLLITFKCLSYLLKKFWSMLMKQGPTQQSFYSMSRKSMICFLKIIELFLLSLAAITQLMKERVPGSSVLLFSKLKSLCLHSNSVNLSHWLPKIMLLIWLPINFKGILDRMAHRSIWELIEGVKKLVEIEVGDKILGEILCMKAEILL